MKYINKIINDKFNLEIPVFIMTTSELENTLNHSPNWWGTDSKEIYDNLIFIIDLNKYRKANWWIKTVSTDIKDKITIRTANTMRKVLELSKR
ncbi:MAG: DUF1697 domain-containing protein [Clostridia bacterium]|nr:DUF1697 domain-containing protein [Clostridia bacterium]